ncbi:hypothetical protein Bca4012_003155 [Brassica carinata]
MAEWSKAPDSSSGPRTRAWVQTPLLTEFCLAWVFTGLTDSSMNQGSMTQDFVTSPFIAGALALRTSLLSAVDMNLTEIPCFLTIQRSPELLKTICISMKFMESSLISSK